MHPWSLIQALVLKTTQMNMAVHTAKKKNKQKNKILQPFFVFRLESGPMPTSVLLKGLMQQFMTPLHLMK